MWQLSMKKSTAAVFHHDTWYHGNKGIKKRVSMSSIHPVRKSCGRQREEKEDLAAGALTLLIGSGPFHAQISNGFSMKGENRSDAFQRISRYACNKRVRE